MPARSLTHSPAHSVQLTHSYSYSSSSSSSCKNKIAARKSAARSQNEAECNEQHSAHTHSHTHTHTRALLSMSRCVSLHAQNTESNRESYREPEPMQMQCCCCCCCCSRTSCDSDANVAMRNLREILQESLNSPACVSVALQQCWLWFDSSRLVSFRLDVMRRLIKTMLWQRVFQSIRRQHQRVGKLGKLGNWQMGIFMCIVAVCRFEHHQRQQQRLWQQYLGVKKYCIIIADNC